MTPQPAVGIDLGTTYSVVAYLDPDGKPRTISNAEGDLLTPSMVLIDPSSIVVGKEAVKAAGMEPDRIADFPKRDMGNSEYHRPVAGERYPPEVLQSLILEKLKKDVETVIGPFERAVITVPAFFNEPRRKATQDAGKLAGIDVLDIINEPTAAALVYGIEAGFLSERGAAASQERILVYDLGGGTFDVTLMEIAGSSFRTVATAGDVYLGGIDWDRRIVDHVAEQFQRKYRGIDPRKDPRGMQKLMREAEDAKRALSVREQVMFTFEHAGEGIRMPITRETFESLTADLLERTMFTSRNLLREAGLNWSSVTRILLVGGSTRMPAVTARLQQESGMQVDRSVSADEAVAHGAAIYADLLLRQRDSQPTSVTLQNVNSHSLGIRTRDSRTGSSKNSIIIPKNTPIPVSRTRRFKTARAGQESIQIKVLEGGDATGKHSTLIGKCTVAGLPQDLPQGTPVDVSFSYGANGRITIHARLPEIDHEVSQTLDRSTGLNQSGILKWEGKRRDRA